MRDNRHSGLWAPAQGRDDEIGFPIQFRRGRFFSCFGAEIHDRLGLSCLNCSMKPDISKAIWILWAGVLIAGVSTCAYREYLRWDADWITKILCEDMPVITGKYGQCLEHYAPAAGNPSANGTS
jgi:hypothetical protein